VRRLGPWAVGIAILAVVATRIPLDAFRTAVGRGPHAVLAAVDLLLVTVFLGTDSVATWIGLVVLRMRRPLRDVTAVRGATYLLFVVNYALGQGGFGYYLHRTGVAPLRAVGATLFLIGTNLATLLVALTIAWGAFGGGDPRFGWVLAAGCAALAVYLAVIAWAPGWLARREALAPLIEPRLGGYLRAMLGRVPHVAAMVLGQWVAMRVWGIAVPLAAGIATLPIIVIVAVLPITPAGIGTTQAAMVVLFSDYATGATADERAANVLAFGMVQLVYGVLASLVIGAACTPFARRVRAALAARAAA
jgi:hypothetical protein